MKIRQVEPISVAGLPRRAPVVFGPGLNVLYGPNGSGKTTLARLVHDDLFAGTGSPRGEADFVWELDARPNEVIGHRLRAAHTERHELANERPSADHAACYFIRSTDLLAASGEDDTMIARHFRRAMAGGLDLLGLERELVAVFPRREPRVLAAALKSLAACENAQSELARRESGLVELEAQAKAAVEARDRLGSLRRRARMLDLEAERAPLAAELEALPPALMRIPPAAAARRTELREQLRRADREVEAAEAAGRQSERDLDALGAGRRPLSPTALDLLAALRRELPRHRADLNEVQRRLQATEGGLDGKLTLPAPACPDIDSADARALAQAIEAAARARFELTAVESERKLLRARVGERGPPGSRSRSKLDGREEPADLETAIGLLDRRLALARNREFESAGLRSRLLASFVLIAAGLALLLFMKDPTTGSLAAGLALGSGLASLVLEFVRSRRSESDHRRLQADMDSASILADIELGDDASLARQRDLLSRRLAEAMLQELRATREAELRVELRDRRRRADENDAELRAWSLRLGFELDPDLPLASLAQYETMRDLRRRADERCDAEAARDAVEDALDDCWEKARGLARLAGLQLGDDAISLEESLRRIQDDDQRLTRALAERELRREFLAATTRARSEAHRRLFEFHARLDLDPDDESGFQRLLQLQDRRAERGGEIDRIDAVLAGERRLLADAPEVLDLDAASLARATREAFELAAREGPIRESMANIRAEVAGRRDGQDLGLALAARERAQAELEAKRELALEATIKRWLVHRVRRDESNLLRPKVLVRARELFASFTQGRYSLEISGDDESLGARHLASGELRPSHRLSDGTRVQLLMAARLAFLTLVESREKLPLLLDEVLATSDSERFAAIVEVLFQEVESGRQVIYCTADPHDLRRLQDQAAGRPDLALEIIDLSDDAEAPSAPRD